MMIKMATKNKNLEAEVDPLNLLGKIKIKHCKGEIRGAMVIAYSIEENYIEELCGGCGKIHREKYNGEAQ